MDILHITKTSLLMVVQLSMPPLIAAIVAGVIISLLQTLLSIQDQTLPFTVKLLAVASILISTGGWVMSSVLELANLVFNSIPDL